MFGLDLCINNLIMTQVNKTLPGILHIKFERTVQKLHKQDICDGHPGFLLFVHFLQNICKVAHLGCVSGYM